MPYVARSQSFASFSCSIGLVLACGLAAQEEAIEALKKRVVAHFEDVEAELLRYQGLTNYGETLTETKPDAEALRVEQELFSELMATTAAKSLPPELLHLGHNLVVFEPMLPAPVGTDRPATKAYLRALLSAAPTLTKHQESALFFATVVAGELGEQEMVAGLQDGNVKIRALVANYLAQSAIYPSSVAPIEKRIAAEKDDEVRASLIRSLAMIGMPSSAKLVRQLASKEKADQAQAAAIFACVELEGFPAAKFLEKLAAVGPKAREGLRSGLDFLKKETSIQNHHGREVGNDEEFVMRFGDLHSCPTIAWLREIGRLEEAAVTKPARLTAEQKAKLFELLVDSKGFGLEAIKGSLFLGLEKTDEPMLLRIRAAVMSSPNELAFGRLRTLAIMLRQVRQGA